MPDTVLMFHPSLPDTLEHPVRVRKSAFEITWSQPHKPNRPDPWQLWEDPNASDGPQPPPKTGAGSGRDKWAAYAAEIGVDVDEGDGKHVIITNVEAHQDEE